MNNKNKKPKSIEVQGVKFSADEVQSVTINRNGHTIYIANENQQKPIVGFGNNV